MTKLDWNASLLVYHFCKDEKNFRKLENYLVFNEVALNEFCNFQDKNLADTKVLDIEKLKGWLKEKFGLKITLEEIIRTLFHIHPDAEVGVLNLYPISCKREDYTDYLRFTSNHTIKTAIEVADISNLKLNEGVELQTSEESTTSFYSIDDGFYCFDNEKAVIEFLNLRLIKQQWINQLFFIPTSNTKKSRFIRELILDWESSKPQKPYDDFAITGEDWISVNEQLSKIKENIDGQERAAIADNNKIQVLNCIFYYEVTDCLRITSTIKRGDNWIFEFDEKVQFEASEILAQKLDIKIGRDGSLTIGQKTFTAKEIETDTKLQNAKGVLLALIKNTSINRPSIEDVGQTLWKHIKPLRARKKEPGFKKLAQESLSNARTLLNKHSKKAQITNLKKHCENYEVSIIPS